MYVDRCVGMFWFTQLPTYLTYLMYIEAIYIHSYLTSIHPPTIDPLPSLPFTLYFSSFGIAYFSPIPLLTAGRSAMRSIHRSTCGNCSRCSSVKSRCPRLSILLCRFRRGNHVRSCRRCICLRDGSRARRLRVEIRWCSVRWRL